MNENSNTTAPKIKKLVIEKDIHETYIICHMMMSVDGRIDYGMTIVMAIPR